MVDKAVHFGHHLLGKNGHMPLERAEASTIQEAFYYPLREMMGAIKKKHLGGEFKGNSIGGLTAETKAAVEADITKAMLAAGFAPSEFTIPVVDEQSFTVHMPRIAIAENELGSARVTALTTALGYSGLGDAVPESLTNQWELTERQLQEKGLTQVWPEKGKPPLSSADEYRAMVDRINDKPASYLASVERYYYGVPENLQKPPEETKKR